MPRLQRRARRVLLIFGILGVVAVAAAIGLRAYLASSYARDLVAKKLGTALGTTVEVEHVDVGWRSSGVRIKVYEAAGGSDPPPVLLTAENADAEVSLLQLVRGETPNRLVLAGAHVNLRLDRDGQILTRFPQSESKGEMPTIGLRDASITIAQEGRPEFQLGGIQGDLTPAAENVSFTGTVHDPNWGEWSGESKWDLNAGTGSLGLRTDLTSLTQEKLQSVPWIPSVVWEQVQTNGDTAAEVRITRENGDLRTQVKLNPRGANIGVTSIDLTLAGVTGTIEIDDAVVHLRGAKAQAANGQVDVSGKLDFGATPSLLQFQVVARGLDLRKLPASWSMPPQLEGELKGNAKIELAIQDGHLTTRGEGKGEVEHARVAGIPAQHVELQLTSDGRRFRFTGGNPAAAAASTILFGLLFQPPNPPPFIELSFDFKDVDIADLIQKQNIQLPIQLAGKVSLSAKARLPLDRVRDLKAYRVAGRATSSGLTVEGVTFEGPSADILLENGVLSLSNLKASVRSPANRNAVGIVSGAGRLGVFPQTDLAIELGLGRLPVGAILPPMGLAPDRGEGTINGKFNFRSALAAIREPKNWTANVEIASDRLRLFGRDVTGVRVAIGVADGIARANRASLRVEGEALSADAQLNLVTPFEFAGRVRGVPREATDLRRLLPEINLPVAVVGRIEASGDFRGTLSPWNISAQGTGGAADLHVASAQLDRVDFGWSMDRDHFQIRDARARAYDGELTAKIELPTAQNADASAVVNFERIDAAPLVRDWPAVPVRLTGRVNGTLNARFAGQPRQLTADLELSAPWLRVSGVPTDQLHGKLHYRPEAVDYEFTGAPLGGKMLLTGRAPLAPAGLPEGRLELERLDLARWSPQGSSLRGRVDLEMDYRNVGGSLNGQGRLNITSLGSAVAEISDQLSADFRIAGSVLTITGPSGGLAGGVVRGRGRYDLAGRERGFISINLTGVDAKRLLSPIPALANNINATLDGQLRGSLGREFNGTGNLSFSRGRVFGLTVTDARIPFDWAFALGGHGELKIRDATAQGGSGRIAASTDYSWGLDNRLNGHVRFAGIDLKAVLTETADFSSVSGRADGRFDFRGENVRDFDDLTGTLAANFTQASALETPILRPIAPYVAPGQSLTGFTRGDLLAYLSHGVFRIQRLALKAPSVRIYSEGSVTIEGRLDLAVNAMTGQIGANPDLIRLAGLRLPAIGPIPVTMIVRASNLLSNHVIRLRVGGTIRAPTVQVNAAALLSEGVLRYFLNSSGVPLP